jgi:hypothetical protein
MSTAALRVPEGVSGVIARRSRRYPVDGYLRKALVGGIGERQRNPVA